MQVQQMASGGQAGVHDQRGASARLTGAEAELRWLIGSGWQVQTGLAQSTRVSK